MVTLERLSWILMYTELNSITRVSKSLGNIDESKVIEGINSAGVYLYDWFNAQNLMHGTLAPGKVRFLLSEKFNMILKNKGHVIKLVSLWLSNANYSYPESPQSPDQEETKYLYIMRSGVPRSRIESMVNLYGAAGCKMVSTHPIHESKGICFDIVFELPYSGSVPDIQTIELTE